jgi:hypothetical protein
MNDEARMSNDEGMTKSEARTPRDADDSFWTQDTAFVVREESDKNRVYDLEERTARFGDAFFVIEASSFVRHSSFGFRHSDHAH